MPWFRRTRDLEPLPEQPVVVAPAVVSSGAPLIVFDATDVQRRALGNLSIPRSLNDLAGHLVEDPHTGLHDHAAARVTLARVLEDLVSLGLAARLDDVRSADQLLAWTDQVLRLPEPKRSLTFDRFSHSWSERLDGSPQYFMTAAGLRFLQGDPAEEVA